MRLLSVITLIAVCFVCSPGSVGSKSVAEQPDISKSGSDFLDICSAIDGEQNGDVFARVHNNATCLAWVEGFRDGFTVHDELLGVNPLWTPNWPADSAEASRYTGILSGAISSTSDYCRVSGAPGC